MLHFSSLTGREEYFESILPLLRHSSYIDSLLHCFFPLLNEFRLSQAFSCYLNLGLTYPICYNSQGKAVEQAQPSGISDQVTFISGFSSKTTWETEMVASITGSISPTMTTPMIPLKTLHSLSFCP